MKKLLAAGLALCLILSAVPVAASAAEEETGGEMAAAPSGAVSAAPATPAVPEAVEEVTVIREEESLRGEYEKHFLMSDGSYQAEVYAYPVHELVDGVWVEIDSTNQNARGDVTVGRETTNILDNFVWEGHGVQSSTGLRLYIGSRSGYTARTYIQFVTMPTIPAGSTITAATMRLTMVSGTSLAYTANAYQVTGGEWDPTTIQWTNKPAANVLLESNISNNDRTKYQFSVLTAVQHWYDGDPTGQNENYGIMLQYYDETLTGYYNSVYSGDVVDTNSRPRLTITYQPVVNEVSILRGATRTLSVSGYTGSVTWTSADPTVATVTSGGVLTGVKVGKTKVTASAGGEELAEFNVFVTIQSGVYYIKRSGSLYMGTSGGVADGTTAALQAVATTNRGQLNQLWRIDYLGVGYYTVRPLYNMNMALRATNGAVDMTTVGYSNVPYSHKWTIEGNGSGYVLKNRGLDSAALRCSAPYPGAGISTAAYSSAAGDFVWLLEGMSSVTPRMLLMDSQTGAEVPGTTVAIDPGTTSLITQIGVTAAFVCSYSTSQTITWVVQDTSVLTVNSASGEIMPLKPGGITKVTASHIYNGVAYGVDFYVYVKPILDGEYFLRSREYPRYLQIEKDDSANDYLTSGAGMEQWTLDGGDYQKWSLQWRGNGYYSIISVQSGKALSVPASQTDWNGAILVQEIYTGADRQLWKITMTEDGCYKIKAKSAEMANIDLVVSVGFDYMYGSDGVSIEQKQYLDDGIDIEKWILCPSGTDVFLLGVNTAEDGHDHHSAYGSVMADVQKLGYSGTNCIITDAIGIKETQEYIEQCKVFVSRSHAYPSDSQTHILLDKEYIYSLGSWHLYNYLQDRPTLDLSNCDLMLFVGCYTSKVEGTSLPDAAVAAGAGCAIGFDDEINCDSANTWTERFFYYYSRGFPVSYCAQRAASECGSSDAVQKFRIVS